MKTDPEEPRLRLLKAMTTMMEDYGMPKFKDFTPAMDILQLVKDAGFSRPQEIKWPEERKFGDGNSDAWNECRKACIEAYERNKNGN